MLWELNNDQIEALFKSEVVGRIGCHFAGITFVVPVSYAYDDGYIYAHSKEGMKIKMMRGNPLICFEVDHIEKASNWQSVIAWGTYEELKGHDQKMGLQKILLRMQEFKPSETSLPQYNAEETHQGDPLPDRSVVFRLKLINKTGRFEKR